MTETENSRSETKVWLAFAVSMMAILLASAGLAVTATGTESLSSLTDVTLHSVLNGQVLTFNSTTNLWENQASTGAFNTSEPYTFLFNGTNGSNGADGAGFNTTLPYTYIYNGTNGSNGANFNESAPYTYLYNGTNGAKGDKGDTGLTGANGTNGTNGTNGVTGLASIASEVSISNSASETQILGYTILANSMAAGTTYKLTATGYINATGTPTDTWNVRIGNVSSLSGYIVGTGAPAISSAQCINKGIYAEFYLTCRTSGATGSIICNGQVYGMFGASGALVMVMSSNTTAQTSFNTTRNNLLELDFKWGTQSTQNILKIETSTIELVKS
jgi:hypothetical protein